MLVLTVHWWPTPINVGGLLVYTLVWNINYFFYHVLSNFFVLYDCQRPCESKQFPSSINPFTWHVNICCHRMLKKAVGPVLLSPTTILSLANGKMGISHLSLIWGLCHVSTCHPPRMHSPIHTLQSPKGCSLDFLAFSISVGSHNT